MRTEKERLLKEKANDLIDKLMECYKNYITVNVELCLAFKNNPTDEATKLALDISNRELAYYNQQFDN